MASSTPYSGWLSQLPNFLTLIRIGLIPVFVLIYLYLDDLHWVAALLFAAAGLTDWLDGYLARRFGVASKFGAFLDPVADKLAVVSALVILIGQHATLWLTLPGLVICARELIISALREWMAEVNRRTEVAVDTVAKVKTTIQMSAIIVLLANPANFETPWVFVGLVLLYVSTVLTLWSMILYLRAAYPALRIGFRI